MPFSKEFVRRSRGKGTRKNRTFRRRVKPHPPRIRRPLALMPHNFVERKRSQLLSLNSGTLDVNGNLLSTNTWSFQVSDLPQIASYATLFEYYKINKVIVEFSYKTGGLFANTSTGTSISVNEINPTLIFKVDHNDVTGDSIGVLLQSMKTHKKQLTNNSPNFSITLKPAVQTEAYKSALATTYIPKWGQWLSMDDTTVPHYGLKLQMQLPAPNANIDYGSLEVNMKYYFTVKNNE